MGPREGNKLMKYYIDNGNNEGFVVNNIEDVTAHLIELNNEDNWHFLNTKVYELGNEVIFNIITKVEYGGPHK